LLFICITQSLTSLCLAVIISLLSVIESLASFGTIRTFLLF